MTINLEMLFKTEFAGLSVKDLIKNFLESQNSATILYYAGISLRKNEAMRCVAIDETKIKNVELAI